MHGQGRVHGQGQAGIRNESKSLGFTLIEILVSFSVFIVAVLAFVKVIVGSMAATNTSHEAILAHEGARRMIETLQDAPFDSVFVLYNGNDLDDPGLPGSAPGQDFAVAGVEPQPDDADGLEGQILFPTTGAAPGILREDLLDVRLGTPRDLSGDALVDALDHSADYGVLPVLVRVEYQSSSGPGKVELRTLLGDVQ